MCTKGSQASCGVWREDSGLDSRPCRKRRPSSRDDGGVSWVFSSCGASVGCLMKYPGALREPLVWRQDNPVFLSSCDGHILEPTLWPKGSQASCGVWREDSGLDSRPCRKRRPSSRDDGGVSWVFSSCGASVGCLMKYHRDFREPLVWRQENPVFHSKSKNCFK